MASIFTKDDNYVDKPNRNTFDLSYQNNLSLKFGKLVPCFCQEVLPGDSFRIKPTFGLRFLPQVFPVQTRMRAHMHFFYVRNRTIWKDWMDFIGKTKSGLTMPYLKSPIVNNELFDGDKSFHESSIYDYMGLPVALDSDINVSNYNVFTNEGSITSIKVQEIYTDENSTETLPPKDFSVYKGFDANEFSVVRFPVANIGNGQNYPLTIGGQRLSVVKLYDKSVKLLDSPQTNNRLQTIVKLRDDDNDPNITPYLLVKVACQYNSLLDGALVLYSVPPSVGTLDPIISNQLTVTYDNSTYECMMTEIFGYVLFKGNTAPTMEEANNYHISVQVHPKYNRNYPFSSLSINTLPYGDGDWQYRINALPFRAYEAIYNSFYRNPENNPFKINGVNEYNVYVKSLEGGAQSTHDFALFNRNWEDDAFTTAVPTPQQGDAPRVGLTGNPDEPVELRWMSEDADVEGIIHLKTDSNGRVIMVGQDNPNSEPNTVVNALNDAINFGITINDLRNVNALQLWLEKNVRKGYKYRDQLLSHYGVSISYNDLLMPEFIGGVSRDVTVNQVTQTVETDTGNLGDMAGQAYVVGDGNAVTKYCDEHGYIIGILSVVPVPNYSQLIPKHFFKHDTFDYFFPEFGKIGMQPITCKEIAATASWLTHKGDETFGYQRAWYDYLANVDQVHGKFNGQFYDFLIQRKFGNVPELGADFTTIKNEDLNNIFYVDDGEDKILGQIYYDVKAIRPIPLFGIPSLE